MNATFLNILKNVSFIILNEDGRSFSLNTLSKTVSQASDLEEKEREDVACMYTDEKKKLMQDGVKDITSSYSKVIVLVEQRKG